jgi:hypothetical protein
MNKSEIRENFPMKKYSEQLCSYFVLQEVHHNFILGKCEFSVVTSFQTVWKL